VPLPADGTVRIGFLAPLSGPQADLGHALVNAATLALFDFGNPKIILMPQDAGETDAQGRIAAQAAIAAGARLLIGPVFAKSVAGAAEIAHAAHINLIAFSSDRSVASPGAWITGFLPEEDVKRILTFANQKGLRQIAALVPESPYGARIKDALNRVVPELQGELVAVESFVEQPTAASEPMRRMAVAQGRPQGANLGDPSWTPRYQAVMLAEGGAMLTSMAALLPYYEIDTQRIRVLGTGLWDDSRISREPTLVGGWFAAADLGARREFNDRYSRTFGKAPPRIATLAYDAVALAAVLAQVDGGDPYSTERLTQSQGFAGIDGIFRLKPDGTSERGLAVIEVQRDGFKVIDPAPTAFPVPAAQGSVATPSM
jgi:ABC-type branched-subunit amino acid transport system substrate-binding protein